MKRSLFISVVLIVIVSLFVGCGKSNNTTQNNTVNSPEDISSNSSGLEDSNSNNAASTQEQTQPTIDKNTITKMEWIGVDENKVPWSMHNGGSGEPNNPKPDAHFKISLVIVEPLKVEGISVESKNFDNAQYWSWSPTGMYGAYTCVLGIYKDNQEIKPKDGKWILDSGTYDFDMYLANLDGYQYEGNNYEVTIVGKTQKGIKDKLIFQMQN